MKKPTIAYVTQHNCLRVTKESVCLIDLGYKVHLLSQVMTNNRHYTSPHQWIQLSDFEETVKLMDKSIDIWHVHNHPNWFASKIRELLPKSKIVFDYHDSNYWFIDQSPLHNTSELTTWYTEDIAVRSADAFIVPSEKCKEELRTRTRKPIRVVPPAVPIAMYANTEWNVWGGLVSAGGHATASRKGVFQHNSWRDYGELYKALQGKRKVFAYSPSFNLVENDKVAQYYMNMGVSLNRFNYPDLIDRIGEHTWNLVGNLKHTKVMDYMAPNKFYDAIAAGVPSLVLNAESVGNLVEKYGIGIYIKGDDTDYIIDQIMKRWEEHHEKRYNLIMKRRKFSMENYIGQITRLYETIL